MAVYSTWPGGHASIAGRGTPSLFGPGVATTVSYTVGFGVPVQFPAKYMVQNCAPKKLFAPMKLSDGFVSCTSGISNTISYLFQFAVPSNTISMGLEYASSRMPRVPAKCCLKETKIDPLCVPLAQKLNVAL
jgi:hypothetical protein